MQLNTILELLILNAIVLLIVDTSEAFKTYGKRQPISGKHKSGLNKQEISSDKLGDEINNMKLKLKRYSARPCSFLKDDRKLNYNPKGFRISQAKCLNYIWDLKKEEKIIARNEKCNNFLQARGIYMPSIKDGRKAENGEFGHMGALGWETKKKGHYRFLCAASLISPKFLITAAHCQYTKIAEVINSTPTIVRLGVENLLGSQTRELTDMIIKRIIIPTHFKEKHIVLIELKENVSFNKNIYPICLWKNMDFGNATVAGWGKTDESINGNTSSFLKTAKVKFIGETDCEDSLSEKAIAIPRNVRTCAIGLDGNVCEGDSGGALFVKLNTETEQPIYGAVAITSEGKPGCGSPSFPCVFVNIFSYINWIEDVVWPQNRRTSSNHNLYT